MIFVDANIPMYLVGSDHPNKTRAQALLEHAALHEEPLVTDAEVFQEVLHRFTAIRRPEAIDAAFEILLGLVDEVLPISVETVLRARGLLIDTSDLSARDAIHAAVMDRHDVRRILSFDAAFDAVPRVTRIS